MHKVEELEKKWFNYKLKEWVRPMTRLSIFSFLIAGSYLIYDSNPSLFSPAVLSEKMTSVLGVSMEANSSQSDENNSLISKEASTKEIAIAESVNGVSALALAPIIPVIDMEKEERISEVKRQQPKRNANVVAAKPNTYLTAKELAVITKREAKIESVPRKSKKMKFQTTSKNYIETIKEKFSKSNNPREALILAKSYYKNANYEASEKWALAANKLDNSLEDSWLIFAKSKAKLGKKKEALTILVNYYKKSNSRKAQSVIGLIKTGKL
ncbi:MAG: Unknown protein [uncultured Sulfurovum sp.]|uniref:Transformation system protein n=1 Tax=uncultured Sulfurovum sp. TaxID=269237 RepID=A0A6S6TZW5_9BACT|nr:MAG: Unknown protein [uncultured Sulfurovum sp.]